MKLFNYDRQLKWRTLYLCPFKKCGKFLVYSGIARVKGGGGERGGRKGKAWRRGCQIERWNWRENSCIFIHEKNRTQPSLMFTLAVNWNPCSLKIIFKGFNFIFIKTVLMAVKNPTMQENSPSCRFCSQLLVYSHCFSLFPYLALWLATPTSVVHTNGDADIYVQFRPIELLRNEIFLTLTSFSISSNA